MFVNKNFEMKFIKENFNRIITLEIVKNQRKS